MTITIHKTRKRTPRLRSMKKLAHNPSGFGKGRWHSRRTLWASKRKGRRLRQMRAASRAMNRARA